MIQRAICITLSVALFGIAAFSVISVRGARTYDVDFSAINEVKGEDGIDQLQLRGLSLRKGTYNIFVGYAAAGPASVEISLDNDTYLTEELEATPNGADSRMYTFEIKDGTDRGRIDFSYPESSQLQLAYITISSERPIYWDGLIIGAVMLLLIPCVWIFMYLYRISTRKVSLALMVILIALQMLPFLLQSGLCLGIDTRAHMMRVEGVFYGLRDGQFPVVIYPEWNNSYGQIGVLYPNLFLYIPALLRIFGMSQLGTVKLFMFIIITASALIAYESFKRIFDQDRQVAIALALVSLDNMRLYNMYGDGRFGGMLIAEMFYPLIIAGLIDIFYLRKNRWYLLAYGMAGVFCSHAVTTSVVCIAVFVFTICSIAHLRDKSVLADIGKTLLLFTGLAVGSALPFLKFYFTDWGQGQLQWEDFVATLWPRGAFYDDKKWIPVLVLFIFCIICVAAFAKKGRMSEIKGTYIIPSLICGTLMLWMSTSAFPWVLLKKIPAIEYYSNMLQDSYRFVSLSACFFACCIPYLADRVRIMYDTTRPGRSRAMIATCVLAGVICVANYAVVTHEFLFGIGGKIYYDEVIGEVEYQMDDYLPAGTDPEWYGSDSGYISDEEAVTSIDYTRSGTEVFYSYTNDKDGTYVEFPKFYYDGYTCVDETGANVPVTKGDKNRVRVYLKTTDQPASVKVWYHVTFSMMFAAALSFGLWGGSIATALFRELFLDKRRGFLYNFKCSAKDGGS